MLCVLFCISVPWGWYILASLGEDIEALNSWSSQTLPYVALSCSVCSFFGHNSNHKYITSLSSLSSTKLSIPSKTFENPPTCSWYHKYGFCESLCPATFCLTIDNAKNHCSWCQEKVAFGIWTLTHQNLCFMKWDWKGGEWDRYLWFLDDFLVTCTVKLQCHCALLLKVKGLRFYSYG